jgi:DNA-binding transcriptional LysR family regulator
MVFPETLVDLQKAKPNLTVRVVEAQPSALMAMLRVGELDLIVCGRNADAVEEDLVAETLSLDRFDIFVRQDHPLLQKATHDLATLAASQRWILPTTTGPSLIMIEQEFARHKLESPRRRMEISSTTVLARLLKATDHLAVTTSQALASEIVAGQVKSLQGDWHFPEIETAIYYSAKRLQSPGTQAFIRSLRRVAHLKQTPFANLRKYSGR